MRETAPNIPMIIPETFLNDTFSRKMIAATIITMIGLVVIIKEALIGAVILNPLKNSNWLVATPKSPHKMSLPRSFVSILGDLKKISITQKIIEAEMTLKNINPNGPI